MNPFEMLGLDAGADVSDEAVHSAFRRRALQCHPDKSGGCGGSEDFQKLIRAKEAALGCIAARKGVATTVQKSNPKRSHAASCSLQIPPRRIYRPFSPALPRSDPAHART